MNLLFEIIVVVFSLLLQIICGSAAASEFPFALCAVMMLSMRRGASVAVVAGCLCGFFTDMVCGREFACNTISFPIAAACGSLFLPDEPMRFFFGDYIMPGCTAVFAAGVLHAITPLFYGKTWYYLTQGGCDTVLNTVMAAGIFPIFILLSDRLAKALDIHRIFSRTIKFALRPARR